MLLKKQGKSIVCTKVGSNTKEQKVASQKQLKQLIDTSKLRLRTLKQNAGKKLKEYESFMSKDSIKLAGEQLQEMYDKYAEEIDDLHKKKEKEIMDA